MKKEKILIVAADDLLAQTVQRALQGADYTVARAKDGIDGLRKVSRSHPDLVIVESGMSPVNRADPCLRIRQAGYLPIIMLGEAQDALEMMEAGADAYVDRNTELNHVVARVRGLLWRKFKFERRQPAASSAPRAIRDGVVEMSDRQTCISEAAGCTEPQQLALQIGAVQGPVDTREPASGNARKAALQVQVETAQRGGD